MAIEEICMRVRFYKLNSLEVDCCCWCFLLLGNWLLHIECAKNKQRSQFRLSFCVSVFQTFFESPPANLPLLKPKRSVWHYKCLKDFVFRLVEDVSSNGAHKACLISKLFDEKQPKRILHFDIIRSYLGLKFFDILHTSSCFYRRSLHFIPLQHNQLL